MRRQTASHLFWNAPHAFKSNRAADPLGFDALREAMSNVLVPFLTGATRHAEHYIAVLVGLRWAKALATNPVDQEIWAAFSRFERGLKQYWHRHPKSRPARNRYLGKRRIKEICEGKRPDVEAFILQDQRAIGLLANYIESLRAMRLVRPGQIVIEDAPVQALLADPRFQWTGSSPGSWDKLDATFEAVDLPSAWPRLGRRLFDREDATPERLRMFGAARAIRRRQRAASWGQLALARELMPEQRLIAEGTNWVTALEDQLREQFGVLLKGEVPADSGLRSRSIRAAASRLLELQVIETAWPTEGALGRVLRRHLEAVAAGRITNQLLVAWHAEVGSTRGTEPWIAGLGERSLLELSPQGFEPDFRLNNLQTLVLETRWAG